MLAPILSDEIATRIDGFAPLFEKIAAESRGTLSTEAIRDTIRAGNWWLAEIANGQAAVIVEPINFKTGMRVLEVVGIAGAGMDEWAVAACRELENFARSQKFHRLRAGGRRGWARIAPKHGWRETRVIVEKDL
jgi:hypothetical protein